jgi:hypothetical protein
MTIPLAVVGGIMGAPGINMAITHASQGNFSAIPNDLKLLAGVSGGGSFSFPVLQQNLTPIIAGLLAHKIAGMAGVNRMIAKAKIPLIRI